jgi:hypothetical protein
VALTEYGVERTSTAATHFINKIWPPPQKNLALQCSQLNSERDEHRLGAGNRSQSRSAAGYYCCADGVHCIARRQCARQSITISPCQSARHPAPSRIHRVRVIVMIAPALALHGSKPAKAPPRPLVRAASCYSVFPSLVHVVHICSCHLGVRASGSET